MNPRPNSRRSSKTSGQAAYTLPEVMLTSTILLMLVAGLLSVHLLALRLDNLGRVKLGATDDARRSLGVLEAEVRSAGWVQVGMGDATTFTPAPPGQPQVGNALQIYPVKTQTNRFIRYFVEEDTQRLMRVDSESSGEHSLAAFVTNTIAFSAEDFTGNIQTNPYNNRVIGLTLRFYQLAFPTVPVGPGGVYDFYQVRTRITRRALE
jgi:hypothetical protein